MTFISMKQKIIYKSLVLMMAGLVSRLIGFAYKIFLAGHMKPNIIGVYQLIFPVYGLCYTLFAGGMQTAISRIVSRDYSKKRSCLYVAAKALVISCSISIITGFVLNLCSGLIAEYIIMEPLIDSSIKILSLCFPFAAVSACINGYYIGRKNTVVPALNQLIEQIVRVSLVAFIFLTFLNRTIISCEIAVIGLVTGEIAAAVFNIIFLSVNERPKLFNRNKFSSRMSNASNIHDSHKTLPGSYAVTFKNNNTSRELISIYAPLTLNRFILSLLHSFEAILFPVLLIKTGLNKDSAYETIGYLTGMAIPFLVFPTAITSAISTLLLPTISEAGGKGNYERCRDVTKKVIKYSLILGFLGFGIFRCFGSNLCFVFYHNETSGRYLLSLSFICPLMYLSMPIPSILNGLGKHMITFRNSCIISIIQIIMLFFTVMKWGINGYFITMYIMQIIQMILDIYSIEHEKVFDLNIKESLVIPGILICFLITIQSTLSKVFCINFNMLTILIPSIGLFSLCFIVMLIITKAIRLSEL